MVSNSKSLNLGFGFLALGLWRVFELFDSAEGLFFGSVVVKTGCFLASFENNALLDIVND